METMLAIQSLAPMAGRAGLRRRPRVARAKPEAFEDQTDAGQVSSLTEVARQMARRPYLEGREGGLGARGSPPGVRSPRA